MGRLTEDATRLRQEIDAMREARLGFIHGLRDTVSDMRAHFRTAQTEMAKRAAAERAAFVTTVRRTVAGLRQELAADIVGARSAWLGRSTGFGRGRTQSRGGSQGERSARRKRTAGK